MHKKSLSTVIGLNIGIIPRKAMWQFFLLWYHSVYISIALFTISLLLYLYIIRNHPVFLFLDINYKFFPCSGIDLGNSRTKRNAAKVFKFQIVHWMTPRFDRVSPSRFSFSLFPFRSLSYLMDVILLKKDHQVCLQIIRMNLWRKPKS